MSPHFSVIVAARELTLFADGAPRLRLPLDAGGRHRLIVADASAARLVVEALETYAGVGVLPAGGGLLGALTITENYTLALRYNSDQRSECSDDPELDAALTLCGLSGERIAVLADTQPMHLERSERWIMGFVRWLLRPPEVLVVDRLFAGLSRRQTATLMTIEAVYHQRHPFRPVLFVDLDSHDLPALPDCLTLTDLAESTSPCPC